MWTYLTCQRCEHVPLDPSGPLGSFSGIVSSKSLTSLVQSIIECSEFPCSQNLRVHASKGTCSHAYDIDACVCDKDTPRKKKTCGTISFRSITSGAGEQFLLQDYMAKAGIKGVFFSQTTVGPADCNHLPKWSTAQKQTLTPTEANFRSLPSPRRSCLGSFSLWGLGLVSGQWCMCSDVFVGPADCNHCICNHMLFSESSDVQQISVQVLT